MKSTILLAFCAALLSSCTALPFVVKTDTGYYASLGGSLATMSATESSSITLPDGTVISHGSTGKDEVKAIGVIENRKMLQQVPGIVNKAATFVK